MHSIRQLDDSVVTQIRSHTILHSLDLVVRELLQNSVDAGADKITIKIDPVSLSVYIHDNGPGITPEDLEKVTLQHYTSKWQAKTFGYKGEALFALKAISNLTIISKADGYSSPFKLTNQVAKLYDGYSFGYFQVGDINPHGTVVIAANIFKNMPVRRQTPPKLEAVKVAILQSLIKKPSVGLTVLLVNHTTFQLDRLVSIDGSDYPTLLFQLFGIKTKFDPVSARFKNIRISGIIGRSPISPKHQYFFVNDRPVTLTPQESKRLNELFTTGNYKYPTFIFRAHYPKQHSHDCYTWNIVLRIVHKIISKFLEVPQKEPPVKCLTGPMKRSDKYMLSTKAKLGFLKENEINGLVDNRMYHVKSTPLPRMPKIVHPELPRCSCTDHSPFTNLSFSREDLAPGRFKVINQIDRKFILLTIADQIVVLDQHASDERIRVEQYLQEFVEQRHPGLRLQNPVTFILHPSETVLFDQYAPNFNTFGIHFATQSDRVVITHLPFLLTKIENDLLKDSLLQHCYDLADHVKRVHIDCNNWFETSYHLPRIITELINSKACRSAIMFGDILTKDEMYQIVTKLSQCKLPFQCAHGRPSIVPIANII